MAITSTNFQKSLQIVCDLFPPVMYKLRDELIQHRLSEHKAVVFLSLWFLHYVFILNMYIQNLVSWKFPLSWIFKSFSLTFISPCIFVIHVVYCEWIWGQRTLTNVLLKILFRVNILDVHFNLVFEIYNAFCKMYTTRWGSPLGNRPYPC